MIIGTRGRRLQVVKSARCNPKKNFQRVVRYLAGNLVTTTHHIVPVPSRPGMIVLPPLFLTA
jgi:hypothetical protein